MHYLATVKDDDESNEDEMTVDKAAKELKSNKKKLTPIQEQMDDYLRLNLPHNILSGNYTEADGEMETQKMIPGKVTPLIAKSNVSAATLDIKEGKVMDLMSPMSKPSSVKKKTYLKVKRGSVLPRSPDNGPIDSL
jgi:hypothetical protein